MRHEGRGNGQGCICIVCIPLYANYNNKYIYIYNYSNNYNNSYKNININKKHIHKSYTNKPGRRFFRRPDGLGYGMILYIFYMYFFFVSLDKLLVV